MRLWLSLLQIVYDKWQVLPRLNQLIGGDKERPSNVNQGMLICAAWTEHEYFSYCRHCVNFRGGQIDLWHTMRLSCISAYFIISVRRIRAAAIAVQKNGNSRKIIRLSSTPLPPFHTIYLSERLLLNTFTSNIFAHSLHKSKGSPWAKKYMNEKRLKCSSTT